MLTNNDINPFDILSGKAVQSQYGTFWFKDPGCNNVDRWGYPNYKLLHRDNDLPAAIWSDGDMWWAVDGKRHRENDKPAIIISNEREEWWYNGVRHRLNGKPAVIYHDGGSELWFDGAQYYLSK